jgi:hypothetical protein
MSRRLPTPTKQPVVLPLADTYRITDGGGSLGSPPWSSVPRHSGVPNGTVKSAADGSETDVDQAFTNVKASLAKPAAGEFTAQQAA